MMFSPEVPLDPAQAEAIARALFAVAKSDGLHEREAVLVASFWGETGGPDVALAELSRRPPIEGAELAEALADEPARILFVKTALLLGWADGELSPAERTIIEQFAAALGVTPERLDDLQVEVKEYLLSHLSHLKNTAVAAEVVKQMKL